MGLDMYLKKRVYQYRKADGTLTHDFKACKFDRFGRSNGTEVSTQAAYWRKANHIHKWFVENVCDGKDDCHEYYCDKDKLVELRGICIDILKTLQGQVITVPKGKVEDYKESFDGKEPTEVRIDVDSISDWYDQLTYQHELTDRQSKKLAAVAKDYLPRQEGFFFGSKEYNLGYVLDLAVTVIMLDEILADAEVADYYYEASW